jgi:hypothetical protein
LALSGGAGYESTDCSGQALGSFFFHLDSRNSYVFSVGTARHLWVGPLNPGPLSKFIQSSSPFPGGPCTNFFITQAFFIPLTYVGNIAPASPRPFRVAPATP